MTAAATYLLRVRLPDRPGALGQLATALGGVDADIESIVVVDREQGFAVDDLLVGVPASTLADRLVSAASSVDGVTVEAVHRHHGRMRVYDELALLDAAASSPSPLSVVVAGLPELLNASYAMVVGGADFVVSTAAPARPDRADWQPPEAARPLDAAELWHDPAHAGPDSELVAVPLGPGSSAALVLGRIGGPAFRPAELMRLAHLANLAAVAIARVGVS
jgi:hypothetical protein